MYGLSKANSGGDFGRDQRPLRTLKESKNLLGLRAEKIELFCLKNVNRIQKNSLYLSVMNGRDNDKRGGKRPGAGRKKAAYKTTTISFRVKIEQAEEIKKLVKEYLKND
jgi:hypothetical protein